MKRAARLQPVQKIVVDAERKQAEQLAVAERALAAQEKKLSELTAYRDDYTQGFARRASGGMGARDLVDYQAFMARLNDAIKQQTAVVQKFCGERDAQSKRWQEAALRAKALGHVITGWQQEAARAADKRDQRETDERAQRRRPNLSNDTP